MRLEVFSKGSSCNAAKNDQADHPYKKDWSWSWFERIFTVDHAYMIMHVIMHISLYSIKGTVIKLHVHERNNWILIKATTHTSSYITFYKSFFINS